MKKEFKVKPDVMKESYPSQFDMFSWQDFIVGLPSPLLLVTSYKANGKENACMQSWSVSVGCHGKYVFILSSVSKNCHLYQTLIDNKCCVLNFFSKDLYDKCMATIKNNGYDTDEITTSGLTSKQAATVYAPLVEECFLNIECKVMWNHELVEGKKEVLFALEATNIIIDDNLYQKDLKRYSEEGYLFNIHNPMNPDSGEITADKIGFIKIIED